MRFLLLLLSSLCFAKQNYIEKWITYRVTEIFEDSVDNESLHDYFTDDAWEDFKLSIEKSHLSELWEHHYMTKVVQFLPIELKETDKNHYAQVKFLVQFSHQKERWVQPFELFLSLDNNNGLVITHFEGITKEGKII